MPRFEANTPYTIMTRNRNKARNRHSLQLVTLCISTAMVLILIGMVVLTVFTSRNLSSYVKENLTLTMNLQPDVTDEEGVQLCEYVKRLQYINHLDFVSKEEAKNEVTKELGADPTEFVGENPCTAEIEIRLKANYANNDSIKRIALELKGLRGVSDVTYRQDLVESVNQTLRKIGFVLLVIAGLLTIISFSLINNTIRLSIYARRFSIHTMKLVGASWSFIRMPFLKQAVSEGFISAMIAIVSLGIGMYFLYDYDSEISVVLNWEVMFITALVMLAFGILITVFCAWLSVNRFLRMKAGDLYKI